MKKGFNIKILLVGDAYSIFLSQLIYQLKKIDSSIQVDVLMFSAPSNRVETLADRVIAYKDEYTNNKIGKTWFRIKKYIYLSISVAKLKKYDVVNIHYISPTAMMFWNKIKKKAKRTILSFWGSDFYQLSDKKKQQMKILLDECDKITFTGSGMMKEVSSYYNNYEKKMSIRRFGLDTLEFIDKLEEKDLIAFRKKFSIPKDKIIVMCGYSSSLAQRHNEIINELIKIDSLILDNCFFIFPMTYGNVAYRKKVETTLSVVNFNSLVLNEFLTPNDNASLRKISDVMLNLQLSDQFSGSMQESLYAGNIVITGSWLPYDEFLNQGIYMHCIQSFENFSTEIVNVIRNLKSLKLQTIKNREIIRNFSHWNNTIDQWKNLYSEGI